MTDKVTILAVDDSVAIRALIKSCLRRLPFNVHDAENGKRALEKLKVINPQIILLDWNMPVMDGITFLKSIRQKKIHTPVIMLTTESDITKVMQAKECNVASWILKPFAQDKLIKTINQVLLSYKEKLPQLEQKDRDKESSIRTTLKKKVDDLRASQRTELSGEEIDTVLDRVDYMIQKKV